jgi:farnesol dehydrogenase
LKILVTGGTGFLGRAVVRQLAPRHRLRLLVRPSASRERFPDGVEFAAGDVTDGPSLEGAAAGCDALLHAAALVKIVAPEAEYERVNLGGLDRVLAAARAAGVPRILYVSSFIALGPTEGLRDGMARESDGLTDGAGRRWINPYERTKAQADLAARRAIAAGTPMSVVYPGVIYGPGELTEGNLVVRHLLDLVHRRTPALLGRAERRWNYVHVDDVAEGIGAVLERAPVGSRYVLGGENVTQEEFYRLAAELTGVAMPRRRLPDGLAKALGAADRAVARLRGATPKLTPDLVEVYRHDWALDSSAAQRDLGYRPRSLRQGMSETIAWLRESGAWAA